MSSRIFQSVILQMKDATKRCFGIVDDQGNVIAASDLSMMGYTMGEIRKIGPESGGELFIADGKTCRALGGGADAQAHPRVCPGRRKGHRRVRRHDVPVQEHRDRRR